MWQLSNTRKPFCVFVVNSFLDLNYVWPLLLHAEQNNTPLTVVCFFTDLKRPRIKIFFRQRRHEVLQLPALSSHHVIVPENVFSLWRILSRSETIVSTSATMHELLRKRIISPLPGMKKQRLVAFDYFGEKSQAIIENIDTLFVSSEFWGASYPVDKVSTGLPYWDLFVWDRVKQDSSDAIDYSNRTGNILLPEIVNEGDRWAQECVAYLNYQVDGAHTYYIKNRLKTPFQRRRNQEVFRDIRQGIDVRHIDSPYVSATLSAVQMCDQAVFTAKASCFVFECMIAGIEVATLNSDFQDAWEIKETASCFDEYKRDARKAREKYIGEAGTNSQQFFRLLQTDSSYV